MAFVVRVLTSNYIAQIPNGLVNGAKSRPGLRDARKTNPLATIARKRKRGFDETQHRSLFLLRGSPANSLLMSMISEIYGRFSPTLEHDNGSEANIIS